ncbi:MAG: hypothetical protein IJZ94_04590 [Clostridia bacterium]|nr:hypothetical protein [Clostridia bacterium]
MKNRCLIILMLLILSVLMLFSGCSVKYEAGSIKVSHTRYPTDVIYLSGEDSDVVLSMFNTADWVPKLTQTACSCVFSLTDSSVDYSPESGLFSDKVNERTLFLSEEQKEYINSLIDDLYGIQQDIYIPSKLAEVYEIKSEGNSAVEYENPISDEVIYTTEKSVGEFSSITVDEKEYGLRYESTMFYPVDNRKVHKYNVDGDNDGIVLLHEDGSVFALLNMELTKIEVSEKSRDETMISGVMQAFDDLVDFSKYDCSRIEGPISDTPIAFGSYKIMFYNEILGYMTDCLTIYATDEGIVTDLWNSEKGIDTDDISGEINENLTDNFLIGKIDRMYRSRDTEYRGHTVVYWPEMKVYNGELCVYYSVKCELYDKTDGRNYTEKCELLIPVRLIEKK